MKKLVTSISLIATAPIFAHTELVPHVHVGSQTNWLPAGIVAGALILGLMIAARKLKARGNAKTQR